MYEAHFGLHELPFALTPDTGYFFAYGHYRDALDTLLVAVKGGEGFIKVTGEVGTGKTLLCRKLLNTLDDGFYTAYVPNPYLTATALTLALADELDLDLPRDLGQHRTLKAITRRLIDLANKGRQVVLCIDEAQAMPNETLEALRLLTNLETEKRKLLQVVLFGQPELDQRLRLPGIRQLRQRITFSYQLAPMDYDATAAYLAHRLAVAGNCGSVAFTPAATGRLFKASRGFPRLVNILAHKALMAAYGQGVHQVEPVHVKLAVADTESVAPTGGLRRWALGAAFGITAVTAAAAMLVTGLPGTIGPTAPPIPISVTAIEPAEVAGSWQPQTLRLQGEGLSRASAVELRWPGGGKRLERDQLRYLGDHQLAITVVTGTDSETWSASVLGDNGETAGPVTFAVRGSDGDVPPAEPAGVDPT